MMSSWAGADDEALSAGHDTNRTYGPTRRGTRLLPAIASPSIRGEQRAQRHNSHSEAGARMEACTCPEPRLHSAADMGEHKEQRAAR